MINIEQINVCPDSIILSKKIHALLNRKRAKGRDIFDIVFLYKFTLPDFSYMNNKIKINNNYELKNSLLEFCDRVDLKELGEDVRPFLINQNEINRVLSFREFVEGM